VLCLPHLGNLLIKAAVLSSRGTSRCHKISAGRRMSRLSFIPLQRHTDTVSSMAISRDCRSGLLDTKSQYVQCDFCFDLFFSFSFSFANYVLVLVSF